MEARINNHRRRQEVSPERAKVRTEKSPKFQQENRKVAVVYYLSKNRQLDHPHFIQVPLSSPRHGLYLRDVIERLNVLRGRGTASMYSWSCKRSYKNGFVWHDLSEDDLILPVHGNEYVLKGSELLDQSNSVGNVQVHNLKQLLKPPSSGCQDDFLSASSVKESKHSQDDELSQRPGSNADNSNGPLSLVEYKVCKSNELADASTQTEEDFSRSNSRETGPRGVSTDDSSFGYECNGNHQISKISEDSVSAPQSSSNARSSGTKTETLESLIRADANRVNSFRIFEEEEIRKPANARLKPSNMLMQLISCGSVSVKNHSFGHIPVYRPRLSHTKSTSPYFPSSLMFEELDCLPEKPRLTGSRSEDKEYFSRSLVETKMLKDHDEQDTLKRPSSYNADRTDSTEDNDKSTTGHSKCIPSLIRGSISKQPRSESLRSPASDKPRDSSDGVDGSEIIKSSSSNGSSKRITEPFSGEKQLKQLGSFGKRKEKSLKSKKGLLQELEL